MTKENAKLRHQGGQQDTDISQPKANQFNKIPRTESNLVLEAQQNIPKIIQKKEMNGLTYLGKKPQSIETPSETFRQGSLQTEGENPLMINGLSSKNFATNQIGESIQE